MSLAEAESWVEYELERWEQERGSGWAITRAGSLLGRIAISGVALDEARAGVSYWVLPEFRGQGVATLALGVVVDWAFDYVGFHRRGRGREGRRHRMRMGLRRAMMDSA